MINGNLGKISISQSSIIASDFYIIQPYNVKDGLKNIKEGTCLYTENDTTMTLTHTKEANSVFVGICLDAIEDKTKDSTVNVLVFGAVKKENVLDGTGAVIQDANEQEATKRRHEFRVAGIYLV